MCLYIGNKKPLVAKKDIVVYKYVESSDGNYKTPFHAFPVKVNALMVAEGGSGDIAKENCEKYSIHGGAIHACTFSNDSDFEGNTCLKAIIKKGTEFWVQDDFKQVAARSLYITDEVVTDKQNTNIIKFCKMIIDEAPINKDGIKIGDVLLADKTYASPLGNFDKSKVIGYVAYFNPQDNSPIHVGINTEYLPFVKDRHHNSSCHSNITYDKAENDFDGYKHTYDIANADDYNADLFKAINYCINYVTKGTNKGDWHLGATGEMIAMAKNLIFINTAIMLVGIGETLNLKWSWTSSQYYDGQYIYSWYITLDDGSSGMRGCRDYKHQVLPFLAFTKQA